MRYYCITMNMPSAVQYIIAIYVIDVIALGCSGLVFWGNDVVRCHVKIPRQISRDNSAVHGAGQI